MKIGTLVKLTLEARRQRVTPMHPWKGEVLAKLPDGWVSVAWRAAAACDACGQSEDVRVWTERIEDLMPYSPFSVEESPLK